MRSTHIPFFTLTIGRKNECAFACTYQNSYAAHLVLLTFFGISISTTQLCEVYAAALYASCSWPTSILSICSMAFITRPAFAGSGSLISVLRASGMICQERPYLSCSQ